jgi:hypothetical protein
VAIAVAAFDRLLSTGVPLLVGILSAQILGLRAITENSPAGSTISRSLAGQSERPA